MLGASALRFKWPWRRAFERIRPEQGASAPKTGEAKITLLKADIAELERAIDKQVLTFAILGCASVRE